MGSIVREPHHITGMNGNTLRHDRGWPLDLAVWQRHAPIPGQNFLIVKITGIIPQDHRPAFRVEPFDPGGVVGRPGNVRRRIPQEAGRGLEKLGHALEYLTDEFVIDGCRFDEDYGRLQAIQLLASLNRQIYFACGVEPTFLDRVQAFFRRFLSSRT